MTRKVFAITGILVLLLVSLFTSVAAQSGTDPEAAPTVSPTDDLTKAAPLAGTKFFTHPVVQILSAYFDREKQETVVPTDPNTPSGTETPVPTEEVETSELGLGPVGEQIAAYHEAGMGFGVLVKIYAMAEASEAACAAMPAEGATPEGAVQEGTPAETECVPVTAEELVTAFNSGTGMGALFKEYGKPALLGVGHVKHALKNQDQQTTETLESSDESTQSVDAQTDTKGKKPDKEKQNNGKGANNKNKDKGKGSNK